MLLYGVLIIFCVPVLLLLAALLRTLFTPAKQSAYRPSGDAETEARARRYAETLAQMIRCETVSQAGVRDREKFLRFHAVLAELFPRVHAALEKTELDGNLLFYWRGKKHDRPLVLMSHQDVVPAEGEWKHAPFSGDIADGKVWGRGASDTKCSLMGFFQAVEELLGEGYVPEQDVWLSSSCTEEWAGDGCPKLVEELKQRGVRPWLVCDEGGGIITDPIGGIRGNFAMVGVFEKGKADVVFTAKSRGGHASAPAGNSPIARLADFVHETEHHSPFRRRMLPEVQAMFEALAPYGSFGLRLVFGNLWLFRPLLLRLLPALSAQARAMLQTTIAFTMQKGSNAFNVLPQEATLGANMRFIPHQGKEESLSLIRARAEKHGLAMTVQHADDYTPPVDIHGEAFRLLQRVIGETFPGLPGSPYVMTGATDARCYQEICDSVVRFAPVIYGPEQMKGMHGLDENIEYLCLPGCVDFYKNLIRSGMKP
ncbi:M20/M25/M40 family metallo-hydrolase [Lachnoclostridium sp. Marseille-P6806]|uniref:M20/M25/M40 family metallo-hydrolase n=1 Tax=Lachnoclostridium sp. Marseille-P6806 TaxID=2364793 RepID=UPI001F5E74D1|nr:M20/M25/M40 family metallo-hydrolase [Lachnoclostridium sp. Marseille-P6806]